MFLRTEEKKRESSRPKDAAPATPVEPSPVSATPSMSLEQQKPSVEEAPTQVEEQPQGSAEPAAENAMDGQERAEGMHDQEAQDERPADDVGLFSNGLFRLSRFLTYSRSRLLMTVLRSPSRPRLPSSLPRKLAT